MYSYYISYIFIYILHYSCCTSCAIFASKPQYSKFYKYQIINFLIHTHIFFSNLVSHIIFHTIISILYSVNNLRTRESHLKKSFSNLFLSSTKTYLDSTRKNLEISPDRYLYKILTHILRMFRCRSTIIVGRKHRGRS